MRPLVTALVVACLAACGSPSIDDTLTTDDVKLPERGPAPTPTTTTTNNTVPPPGPDKFALTVTLSGTGTGTIYSTPTGVTCTGATCKGLFARGTAVTLQSAPAAGAVFTAWSGGCTGSGACAAKLDRDIAIGADFQSLDGTWSGTYTNGRVVSGCSFTNAGNLNVVLKTTGTALSSAATNTGLELRSLQNCQLVGMTTGSAPDAPVTFAAGTLTGTWTFNVVNANGTLAFPFTAKITGKTMTGSWTCPTCTGTFTLTKP